MKIYNKINTPSLCSAYDLILALRTVSNNKTTFLVYFAVFTCVFLIMGSNQCLVMNDKTFKNMQEGRERVIRTARLLCRVAPVPFAEH